jgi:hypothetical protein
MIKNMLRELLGELPVENRFRQMARFHQSWWRAFVLAEEPGIRPGSQHQTIGSTILQGEVSRKNFLSRNISEAVEQTIQERKLTRAGIIAKHRLFNNLLSSQPLCFNFFGEFKADTAFALQVLQKFFPALTEVSRVIFEFAPVENFTNDNSAFDVAFEVMRGSQTGLIGLECKYTDTFSQKEYDKAEYRQIYAQSSVFSKDYKSFTTGRFNQLFRNQLIAEALLHNKMYDFVTTGLFCHPDDEQALKVGMEFQGMLAGGEQHFQIITYQDFIEKMQQLPLDWDRRELSMLLWARYCSTRLSGGVYGTTL